MQINETIKRQLIFVYFSSKNKIKQKALYFQNLKTQETSVSVFKDGLQLKQNNFFSGQELRLCGLIYIDDFELCNPLGTSCKKHKLCAVYWVLNNLPPGSNSSWSYYVELMMLKHMAIHSVRTTPKRPQILERKWKLLTTARKNTKGYS